CSTNTASSTLHIPFGTVPSAVSPTSIGSTSALNATSLPQISLNPLNPPTTSSYGNTNGYYYVNASMPYSGYSSHSYSTQYAGLNNASTHSASLMSPATISSSTHHHPLSIPTASTVSPTAVFPASQLQYSTG